MSNESLRNEIITLLCDTTLFSVGSSYYSWEVAKIVLPLLPPNMLDVVDFNNNVREALETISGYKYSNGTQCLSKRSITFSKIIPAVKSNPHGYNIIYTFN